MCTDQPHAHTLVVNNITNDTVHHCVHHCVHRVPLCTDIHIGHYHGHRQTTDAIVRLYLIFTSQCLLIVLWALTNCIHTLLYLLIHCFILPVVWLAHPDEPHSYNADNKAFWLTVITNLLNRLLLWLIIQNNEIS